MNKRIFRILLFLLALPNFINAQAPYDFKAKNSDDVDLYYKIISSESKTVRLVTTNTSYSPYRGLSEVIIPSNVTYEGDSYTVTEIGDHAFYTCSSLTSVTFPETLVYIGYYAFDRTKITTMELPETLNEIGGRAFSYVPITELTLPSGIETIGFGAFDSCKELRSVVFPANLKKIEGCAFEQCESLTDLDFPYNLTEIGYEAFAQCTGLTRLDRFPKSLKTIGAGAFMGCVNLNYAYIPSNIEEIGGGAFSGTKAELNLGTNKFVVQNGALYTSDMETLICYVGKKGGEFRIPDGVKTVERWAFSYNDNLTSIIFPNSVTKCRGTISDTSSVEYIHFPEFVEDECFTAFERCTALKRMDLPKNIKHIGYMAFYGCSSLESVEIPETVNYIEYYAFGGCKSLKSLKIPASVNKISYYAFAGCTGLKTVYSEIEDVKGVTHDYSEDGVCTIFGYTNMADKVLVVPQGKVDDYKAHYMWNNFGIITDNTHSYSLQEDVILSSKKPTALSVSMQNQSEIIGFQCDLVLPNGMNIETDDEGELAILLSDRADKTHSIMADQTGGIVRIVCISPKNASFSGEEGELFSINLIGNPEISECTIEIKNIILAEKGNIEHYLPPVWATYVVRDYTPGDSNDDGKITIGDVTCAIDFMMGKSIDNFSLNAADLNEDGKVTIGDITTLIDLVLSSEINKKLAKQIVRHEDGNNEESEKTDYFKFNELTGKDGSIVSLDVECVNSVPFIAFQAEIVLPEGVSICTDEDGDYDIQLTNRAANHSITSRKDSDNVYKVAAVSFNNKQFKGSEGVLFSCPLYIDCEPGEYDITLKNVILALPGNDEVYCPDYTGKLIVTGIATEINNMMQDVEDEATFYNLQGVKVQNPDSGIYIRISNGKSQKIKF